MRVCGECGKDLEGSATRCPFCGSTKVSYVAGPAEPTPPPEQAEKSGGITIIFEKEHARPAEEEAPAQTEGDEYLEPQTGEEEPSALAEALQWVRRPRNALLLGAVLLALGTATWWMLVPHRVQVEEVAADPRAVDPVLAKEFTKLIEATLPEKLEWGREILKRRVPSRFPEELIMDADQEKAEIRYANNEKSEAEYRVPIAYHYKDTNKKLFPWTSVQFFFQFRNGKWFLNGDRWPREWEIMFE